MRIDVLIPAYNEENAVGHVVRALPKDLVRHVLVVNNASRDRTRQVAEEAGALVLDEPQKGYGRACLSGIAYLRQLESPPDILVFIDADFSDYPEELPLVVAPLLDGKARMVIGSRALGRREKGSMTLPQRFGNKLATYLLRRVYGAKYTDLGPFRAIFFQDLLDLNMVDENFGWTIEMQIKAYQQGMRHVEVPVNYKKRIGVSKVSGTVSGVIGAGYKILYTLFKYRPKK
ncbi:MAG: glycosyltransferase family 2 protein [Nitritalea sp.]